jgi:hypothetical protein
MTDEPYNAAERSHVKAAAKAAKRLDADRGTILRTIMDSSSGRAWILDRLERCHVFASSYSDNHLAMAFAEGERNIGLQDLSDLMQFTPDAYVLMMREANERRTAGSAGRQHPDEGTTELIE